MPLFITAIDPQLKVLGPSQQFIFNQNVSSAQFDNSFVPTVDIAAQNNFETRNSKLSGYRWIHKSTTSSTNGSLTLQSFVNAQNSGINLMSFNEDNSCSFPVVVSVPTPTNSSHAANKEYVDSAIATHFPDYPNNAGVFLRGDKAWSNILVSNSAQFNFSLNNTNPNATQTGLSLSNNGNPALVLGFNNAINQGYLLTTGNSVMSFGINNTAFMRIAPTEKSTTLLDLFDNSLVTSGGLYANRIGGYSQAYMVASTSIVIADVGNYKPYNGGYGYLNSSGKTGTASGQYSYSLDCTNRVKASEFNAVSSIKIKNIQGIGEDIEQEALRLFNQIRLYKYSYKDKVKNGEGATFGVIAEYLQEILPDYVSQDQDFVPNILQECQIKAVGSFIYSLEFTQDLNQIEGESLRLLASENALEVTITKIEDKHLLVKSDIPLPEQAFAYGTYESCPSVTKNKLFELSMVVLKNALRRIEVLENKLINI
jgi:hypothetical protein